MSGSVTVVGSKLNGGSTGIITVTGAFVPASISPLQSLLSSLGTQVEGNTANFENIDVAGLTGSQTATVGGNGTGLFELSNTNSTTGATTAGSANVSVNVPAAYSAVVINAPGSETVSGGGYNGLLAILGGQSSVSFNTNGGSGTVVAGGGGDFVVASGTTWSLSTATTGNDTINSVAANSTISTAGQGNATGNAIGMDSTPSNVVGLAGTNALVNSDGTNDLVETYAGQDTVNVENSANVLINGGADTVFAAAGSTAVKAFFNLFGGTLDFINQSTSAATVSGAVPGASGGSTTAFGGTGGGVYIGGTAGNNSLVGGTGSVTLVGAGTNNFLSAQGSYGSYDTQNVFNAGDGGATMVAGASTNYNEFFGGNGTDSIVSFGSGIQTYYVGATGSEVITGSTVTGATNNYYFDQASNGAGADAITDFRVGTDHILINGNGSLSGVSIAGYSALSGNNSGTLIYLSDNTTIKLYGVSTSSLNASIIGGTTV